MAALTHFTATISNFVPPAWFIERWQKWVYFGETISSRLRTKSWPEFETDLQRAMEEGWAIGSEPHVVIIYVHECGNVTRADVRMDEIHYSEPDAWHEVPGVPPHEAWDACVDRPYKWKPRRDKSDA